MLIRCPTCASRYDLPSAMLDEGRILRCAHCRDAWAYRAEADVGGPQIVVEAAAARPPSARSDGAAPTPRRAWRRMRSGDGQAQASSQEGRPGARPPWHLWRPGWAGRAVSGVVSAAARRPAAVPASAGATLLAAVLLVGAGAVMAGKARVVAAFPASEAVFATLGLPVNLPGLALGELRSTVATGDGPAQLTLEGRITNLRPDVTPVPALRIAVRDKDSRELYHWTAPAPKALLAAGETVLFRSRLTAPPRDGQKLAVSFADAAPDRRRFAEAMPSDR